MKRNYSESKRPNTSGGYNTSLSVEKFSIDPYHPYASSSVIQKNLESFIQSFDDRPGPNEFAHSHVNYYKVGTPREEGANYVVEQKKRQIKGEQAIKDVLEVLPEMSKRVAIHQKETVHQMNLLRKNKLGLVQYENQEEEEKEKLRQNLEKRQKKDIQYKFKNVAHKQRQMKTLVTIQTMVGRIKDDKQKERKVVKYITDYKKKKSDLMKPILLVGQHRKGEGLVVSPKSNHKKQLTAEITNMRQSDKLIEEFGMFFKNIPLLSIDNTNQIRTIQPTVVSPQKINFLRNYESLINDDKVRRIRIRKVAKNNYLTPKSMNEINGEEHETFFPTQAPSDKHIRAPDKKHTQKSNYESGDDKEDPVDDRNEYYQEYLNLLLGEKDEQASFSNQIHSYSDNLREIYSRDKKVRKKVGESLSSKFEIISDDFKKLDEKYNRGEYDILKPEMNKELIHDMQKEKLRRENDAHKKKVL